MFKNYLKIACRNLMRQKEYSFLNITGLTIGTTCCILLLLYLQFELSYDQFHTHADPIYRVIREGKAFTPAPLGPKLMADLPEIEAAARFIKDDHILIAHENENFLENDFYWADPEMFNIFTFHFLQGNPQTALNEPFSILLSEKIAKKYFKDGDPIGKRLKVQKGSEFIVTGIFADLPENSHFNMNFIVPYRTYFQISGNEITNWFSNFTYTYLLMREGVQPADLERKITTVIESDLYKNLPPEILSQIKAPYPRIFYIQPLTEIHLYSHLRQEIGDNNDIKYIWLFAAIALMILMIACMNYINLATARAVQRGKEVGIRKVVGAQRIQVWHQFFGESLVLTLLTMVISIILVQLALPAFNNLVDRRLQFNPIQNPQLFFGLILLTILVGFVAGSYPALSISGFKPILVLKGAFTRSSKGVALRNTLVVAQFAITIFLIICTLIIRNQLHFVKNFAPGYSKDQIITLPVRDREIRRGIQAIKAELLRHPNIRGVTTAACLPNDINTFTNANWPGVNPEARFTTNYNTVDYDFIDLFEIELVAGRNFSSEFPADEKGAFLLNEAAVKAAQFTNPVGQEFIHWAGDTGRVVGVVKDFHLHSLHQPIEPLYLFLAPRDFSFISVKINATDIPATIAHLKGVLHKFSPDYPFEYSFFDEIFAQAYKSEQRIVAIFSSFTILAILIACLGLFGLVSYSVASRIKEIGIRKVLGASVPGILLLLIKEFFKWILISNLLAWPLAFLYSQRWLQNFAYRTPIDIWVFFISTLLALATALITVSYQTFRAAYANPVVSLRYE